MNKIYNNINERLEYKRAELKQKQEYFSVFCDCEINTSSFERNAINDLLVMQQLKSEIKELEHLKMLCQSNK